MAETTNNDNGRPTDNEPPRLALRPREAAAALGISPRKLTKLTSDPRSGIPHKRLGGALLYPVDELRRWLAGQTNEGKES